MYHPEDPKILIQTSEGPVSNRDVADANILLDHNRSLLMAENRQPIANN